MPQILNLTSYCTLFRSFDSAVRSNEFFRAGTHQILVIIAINEGPGQTPSKVVN